MSASVKRPTTVPARMPTVARRHGEPMKRDPRLLKMTLKYEPCTQAAWHKQVAALSEVIGEIEDMHDGAREPLSALWSTPMPAQEPHDPCHPTASGATGGDALKRRRAAFGEIEKGATHG